jgi:hypothetical protein
MAISEGRKIQSNELVNDMQMRAILFVQSRAEKNSADSYNILLAKFLKLKYSEQVLKQTLRWIRLEAPIIIHFNPQKVLEFFVKDTHYRNQFETKMSGGTLDRNTRIGWEDALFGNIYHNSNDFDRVKYGVLNIVNDPSGVVNCFSYGDSYLVLNNDTCRLRTTFASGDTGGANQNLASCENYCHVLSTYTEQEIKDVVCVAIGKSLCRGSDKINQYKEIQIHGPLMFSRDFNLMVLEKTHQSNKRIVELANIFAQTYPNINVIWKE